MSVRPPLLAMLFLAVATSTHAQSRTTTPVLSPGAPVIEWTPLNGEWALTPDNLCGSAPVELWCPGDVRIKLMQAPLSGTSGNLTVCYQGNQLDAWYWCVWRYLTVGKQQVGSHTVPKKATQWLTSLLPGRRLVRYGTYDLYVAKVVGTLPDARASSSRAARPTAYSATSEGTLTTRSPAPTLPSEERATVSMESLLVHSPRPQQPDRFQGSAKIEGTRLDLAGGRYLVVEGGELRLMQGTSVLEKWPVSPTSYIMRFADGTIEIQTLWARKN
jgi:hypothetical protein